MPPSDPARKIDVTPNATTPAHDSASDAAPYGGFVLQYGDTDQGPQWAGLTVSSPRVQGSTDPHPADGQHAGKKYVAELLKDLILLGYLAPSRTTHATFNPSPRITPDVIAAVLALKYDLTRMVDGYGVPFVKELSAANTNPTVDKPGPIYFTTDWCAPRNCLIETKDVFKYLDANNKSLGQAYGKKFVAVGTITSDAKTGTLEYTDGSGEAQKKPFDNAESEYTLICTALSQLSPADAKQKATIAKLKQRKKELEALFKKLVAVLKEARLPLGAAIKAFAGCRARFETLKDRQAHPEHDVPNEWKQVELDDAFRKRNEMQPQAKDEVAVNYYQGPRDQLVEIMQKDMTTFVEKAASGAKALADRVAKSDAGALELHNEATDFRDALLKFQKEMNDYIDTFKSYDFKPAAERYHKMLRRYTTIDKATAFCIKQMVRHRRVNGHRVFVSPQDEQTKFMTVDGTIVGKERGNSDAPPPREVLDKMLSTVIAQVEKEEKDVAIPVRIMAYAYMNESGLMHAKNPAGLKNIPQCGTDFANPANAFHVKEVRKPKEKTKEEVLKMDGARALSFDECVTNPEHGLIVSRGWGFTQLTPPNIDPAIEYGYFVVKDDGTLEDHSSDRAHHITTWRGLPVIDRNEDFIPAYIASTEGSLNAGIRLFVRKFKATPAKRSCTFTPKHDCETCLARFTENDVQFSHKGSLMSKSGYQTVQNDIAAARGTTPTPGSSASATQAPPPADATSGSPPTANTGADEKAGKKKQEKELTPEEKDVRERLDWPCSWPTARMYYAGLSAEGFNYVRQSITYARKAKEVAAPTTAPAKPKGAK